MPTQPSPKTLKLALAMGGGVSLGAFSGAGLTESLKQLLLFGRDEDGRPYGTIEVDTMSGASAGAISLLTIIVCLMDCRRYIMDDAHRYYGEAPATWTEDEVKNRLEAQFGKTYITALEANDKEKYSDLFALEVAQMLQEQLWVEEVSMKGLIPLSVLAKQQKSNFSLLSRDKLLQLVDKYILHGIEYIDLANARIINLDRFLFACTLTGLLPQPLKPDRYDARDYPLVGELQKAHASYNHRELRVFDFQLGVDASAPPMPKAVNVRRPTTQTEQSLMVFQSSTWARIAATAIACGAFPFAFEPVILQRYKHERNPDPETPERLSMPWQTREYHTVGNADMAGPTKVSIRSDDIGPSLLFSYVDGGALNNEPIREAFAMSSYMDLRSRDARAEVDRIVLFVDPIVRTSPLSNNSPDFYQHRVRRKKNTYIVEEAEELDKFLPYTSSLVGMLRNQGAIKEEHRRSTYMQAHDIYEELSRQIRMMPMSDEIDEAFVRSVDLFKHYHNQHRVDRTILVMDLDDDYFLRNSVRDYVAQLEADDKEKDQELDKRCQAIKGLLKAIHHDDSDGLDMDESIAHFSDLLRALRGDVSMMKKLFYDWTLRLVLDIDQQDRSALRVAVTPVRYDDDECRLQTISLPGAEFQAFGGFAHHAARAFSSQYARYCAYHALARPDFRKYFAQVMGLANKSPASPIGRPMDDADHSQAAYQQQAGYFSALCALPAATTHSPTTALSPKAIAPSPLASPESAAAYLRAIRDKVFCLVTKRLGQIIWHSVIPPWPTLVLYGLVILAWMAIPFAILHISPTWLSVGALAGHLLATLTLLIIIAARIRRQLLDKANETFNYQIFPNVKIEWQLPARHEVRYYRLNSEGPYHRVKVNADGHLLFALPFYLQRDIIHPDDLSKARWYTLSQASVEKPFDQPFDRITHEMLTPIELRNITFYRRRGKAIKDFHFDLDAFHQTPHLTSIELFISPYVLCTTSNDRAVTYTLEEGAKPLWQEIRDRQPHPIHLPTS